MKDNVILEVKNVEKFFYGNKKLFQKDRPVVKAVNDVSFTINESETFGIVGEDRLSTRERIWLHFPVKKCVSCARRSRSSFRIPMRP